MPISRGRRRLTCHHEAGHALTRWYFGHRTDRAVVLTVEDPMAILCEWDRRGKWRGDDMGLASVFRGRIMTVMVGAEAEVEVLGQCQGGDGDDRYQIALMLHEIAEADEHERIEQRLRRAARYLVRRHRADIERVAASLMERETLTGDEIDAMLPPGFMARPEAWALVGG